MSSELRDGIGVGFQYSRQLSSLLSLFCGDQVAMAIGDGRTLQYSVRRLDSVFGTYVFSLFEVQLLSHGRPRSLLRLRMSM